MITLRVVVDGILELSPRGIASYSEELTREMIVRAPKECEIVGVVSAIDEDEELLLGERLPGLSGLHRLPLGRRELRTAWQHGFTSRHLGGMVHSPSLLAPLARHDRSPGSGEQTVVTIHDTSALQQAGDDDAHTRQLIKRAYKHADAVVVTSHATAEVLASHLDFGDRVRVIPGAVRSSLVLPNDVDEVIADLGLSERYVLALGDLAPSKNLEALFRAAADPTFPDIAVLVVGPSTFRTRTIAQALFESGAPAGRIEHRESLSDQEVAAVIARATAVVVPSLSEGFSMAALAALHLGTPVIHSDDASLLELTAGAGVVVEREGPDFEARLAVAIASVTDDDALRSRLSVEGRDRSRAFSWQDSADRVWQLHADL